MMVMVMVMVMLMMMMAIVMMMPKIMPTPMLPIELCTCLRVDVVDVEAVAR